MIDHCSAEEGAGASVSRHCCLQALYQPQGGLLASERCIEAHVALAQQAGAEVRTGEAVTSWHREASPSGESDIAVVTNRGSYRCRKLLLTAGAWLPQLVPALQVRQQQRSVPGHEDPAACAL